MPLDFEMNTNRPVTKVIFSKNVELIAAASLLADAKHHQFAKEWSDIAYKTISEKSLGILKYLSNLPIQGLEVLEFILEDKILDDSKLFINSLIEYNDTDFIYKIFSEELSYEEINRLKEDEVFFEELIKEKKWLVNGNVDAFKFLVNHTKAFKYDLAQLYKELDAQEFDNKLNSLKTLYDDQISDLNNKLMRQEPLDLAQELMGKKFARVFDFKEYIFIPSFFISPHNIRTFNNRTQIVVYDIRSNKDGKREEGEKISESLKVISDKTRLEILRLLISKANYGKTIADRLDLSTATISHHLEQLKKINLVTEERVKNYKYFKANEEEIDKLFEAIINYLYNK